jgi:NCS1 family nucleobase:cation symporter-1
MNHGAKSAAVSPPAKNEPAGLSKDELRSITKSPYWSIDLRPVQPDERKWGLWDIAVLWVSMSACITTYMLASSMISEGANWWQAVMIVFLGNVVVLVPMTLNAHAGTKYGIPFPIYCRASFGILGANVPAVMRALVACGWFGIQTWIGGEAIYIVLSIYFPGLETLPKMLGINFAQFLCFLAFWGVNVLIVWNGIETIRLLMLIKAPLLIVLGIVLLVWAAWTVGGFGPMLSKPSEFRVGGAKEGMFWAFFFPALTANVGYWATLSLNIPDFSRYARKQSDQVIGQAIGLPSTMALYAFIGIAVTSATAVMPAVIAKYGKEQWDPIRLLPLFDSPLVQFGALAAIVFSTLATNIAANAVGPANDFAHLAPKYISFRIGGLITAILAVAIMPWKLVSDPNGYIYVWLIGYSSLLGAIGGILITDYFILRKTQLDLPGLYRERGPYWYTGGVNYLAIFALGCGIAPCVPGFVLKILSIGDPTIQRDFWMQLYDYAWFLSFGISAAIYWLLMLSRRKS